MDSNICMLLLTQPSLQAKLKSDENGHALKVASDTVFCFVDKFLLFFLKNGSCFLFH